MYHPDVQNHTLAFSASAFSALDLGVVFDADA